MLTSCQLTIFKNFILKAQSYTILQILSTVLSFYIKNVDYCYEKKYNKSGAWFFFLLIRNAALNKLLVVTWIKLWTLRRRLTHILGHSDTLFAHKLNPHEFQLLKVDIYCKIPPSPPWKYWKDTPSHEHRTRRFVDTYFSLPDIFVRAVFFCGSPLGNANFVYKFSQVFIGPKSVHSH